MVIDEKLEQKLKLQLGTWYEVMKPLIQSKEWDQLYANLKATVKAGKTVIPKSEDLWKSLQLCDRHKMKAIVILQCPYATKRQDVIISNGIPMDCSNIKPYEQPSLYQWNQAIESQYGFNPDNEFKTDLSYLLQEEHVLLINSALSVELSKVDSHAAWWEPIMKYILEEIIGKLYKGLPIVLVGSQAQKLEKYINPMVHYIKKTEHPAAAAHQNRAWKHEECHKWCNEIIRQNNGESEMINWQRKKAEPVRMPIEKTWMEDRIKVPPQGYQDVPW